MRLQTADHVGFRRLAVVVTSFALAASCGGRPPPPKRGVLEQNMDEWSFGRYQQLLDVEVWVPKNPGVAHTASYVQKDAQRGHVEDDQVVHAFVTRYRANTGIQARLLVFVKRLAREAGYLVEEARVKNTRLVKVSGHGEVWVLWAADRHLVKLGGRGLETVPEVLIRSYAKRYPSRLLPAFLEGALPAGEHKPTEKKKPYDEKNPKPDWDDYRDRQSEAESE